MILFNNITLQNKLKINLPRSPPDFLMAEFLRRSLTFFLLSLPARLVGEEGICLITGTSGAEEPSVRNATARQIWTVLVHARANCFVQRHVVKAASSSIYWDTLVVARCDYVLP